MLFWRNKLTETEFTNKLIKAINKSFENVTIELLGDLELNVIFVNDDNAIRMFLHNAYNDYIANPKLLKDIISVRIKSLEDSVLINGNISDVIPVIKTVSFLNGIEAVNPGGLAKHVYEQYNEELYIFYVEDKPNSMSYILWEDFHKLGVSLSDLRELACENLFKRYEIKRQGSESLFMLTCGGNYEASLLLLDIWDKSTFPVKGNIVVGVPSRDVVLVTGSLDSKGLHKMYDLTHEIISEGNYPVSDKMHMWNGECFEVFKM